MIQGRTVVAQLGARMHYAVPRILAAAGLLERLFTDICAVRGWPRVLRVIPASLRPAPLRRLAARVPRGVPTTLITAFSDFGREYARRRSRARTATDQTAAHLWAGREFGRRVVAAGFGDATAAYCFNSAGLQLLQGARSRGLRAVLEQTIAPKRIERQLLEEEQARFPDWRSFYGIDELAEEFMQREEAEWQQADVILCASEFVREGIRQCGGPVEKCVILPYGVDLLPQRPQTTDNRRTGQETRGPWSVVRGPRSLRVLTVGAVGLRKGSPYVLEAAKRLKGRAEFRMVGTVGVPPEAQAELRKHVDLTGPVLRSEVAQHYEWADVFLFPSICEGSATVTYEALAYGLPVVCTANTGSVVRDTVEGFIVPIQDSEAIAERLQTLAADPAFRNGMSARARKRANDFTLEAYSHRLIALLTH